MMLSELNQLDPERAQAEFMRCCASTAWARLMTEARPFRDFETLATQADGAWAVLGPADWLEAFAAHPPIGGEDAARWSAEEQAGARSAPADIKERLATGNREYRQRFGYTFLICATGKTAAEMLAALERRLGNEPDAELRVGAEEQRKITHLRLAKLLSAGTVDI